MQGVIQNILEKITKQILQKVLRQALQKTLKKTLQKVLLSSCVLLMGCFLDDVNRAQADAHQQATEMQLRLEQMDDNLQLFSPAAQEVISREVLHTAYDGVISAQVVTEVARLEAVAIPELMLKFLPLASHYALPPVSHFRVGAVSQGETGALYLGANLEIAQAALSFVVHAEQSAINNALLHGEPGIERIAVSAAPCGHCRQFLNELKAASELEIIVQGRQPVTLAELLPAAFGPADLGIKNGLFSDASLNKESFNKKSFNKKAHNKERTKKTNSSMTCPTTPPVEMLCLAQETARQSYSPYSASPSAVVLKVKDRFYTGAYIENAAYNPSLPPVLSALDRLRFQETDFSRIQELLLFEAADAGISQASYTQAVLSEIAPGANFKIVTSAE